MRIEWCKARARDARWSEEVSLLIEEMRRVIEFFKWQADWWKSRGFGHVFSAIGEADSEGFFAYAERQSHLRLALMDHFKRLWSDVPSLVHSEAADLCTASDTSPSILGPPPAEED